MLLSIHYLAAYKPNISKTVYKETTALIQQQIYWWHTQHHSPELCNTWLKKVKDNKNTFVGEKHFADIVKEKNACYKWPCVSVHKISHPVFQHHLSLSAKSLLMCVSTSCASRSLTVQVCECLTDVHVKEKAKSKMLCALLSPLYVVYELEKAYG